MEKIERPIKNFRSKRTKITSEDAIPSKKLHSSKMMPSPLISCTQSKRISASQPLEPSKPSPSFGPFQPPKVATTFIPSLASRSSKNALKNFLSKEVQVECVQDKFSRDETLHERENNRELNSQSTIRPSPMQSSSESDFREPLDKEDQEDVHQSEDTLLRPPSNKKIYRPQIKQNWKENSYDLDEEVEIEEVQEDKSIRLGIMSGTITARHVWMLPKGTRFIVPFNEFDQPIRKGGIVLVHFLSDISKNRTYCPLGEANWHKVDKLLKNDIVDLVREKFVLPNGVKIDEKMLSIVGKFRKQYKSDLKREHYNPTISEEQFIKRKPSGVIKDQWVKLFSYWRSKISKKLSEVGQKARASHAHKPTTGSRSIPQWRIEFEKIHKRKPRSELEFFRFIHLTKNGGYVDNTLTQEFVDYAKEEVSKRVADHSQEKSLTDIENDVYNEVMHSKDSNRVVGYGYGVNKSDIFGLKAELKRRYNGSVSGSSEIQEIKSVLASMEKKNTEIICQLQKDNQELRNQNEEVNKKNDARSSIEKKNTEIICQLQKDNQKLRKQNEEVNKKNDAILAQLSLIMSKLDKDPVNRSITKESESKVQHEKSSWQAPPYGVLKWNTCGVRLKGFKRAGVGGILRDWDKDYFCLFSKSMVSREASQMDFLAILEAIKLSVGVNWVRKHEILVESDSSIAIAWAKNSSPCPQNMKYEHNELMTLVKQCTKVTFIHKERAANEIAIYLANQATSYDEAHICWYDEHKR